MKDEFNTIVDFFSRNINLPGMSNWVSIEQNVQQKDKNIKIKDSKIKYIFYFSRNDITQEKGSLTIIDYFENIAIEFALTRIKKNSYIGKATRFNNVSILLHFKSKYKKNLNIEVIVNDEILIKEILEKIE